MVGALSPVSHKKDYIRAGDKLHSISKSVISQVIIPQVMFFSSLFIFRGHSTQEPASNRVTSLLCRPTQEPALAKANTSKKSGEVLEKMQVNGLEVSVAGYGDTDLLQALKGER